MCEFFEGFFFQKKMANRRVSKVEEARFQKALTSEFFSFPAPEAETVHFLFFPAKSHFMVRRRFSLYLCERNRGTHMRCTGTRTHTQIEGSIRL